MSLLPPQSPIRNKATRLRCGRISTACLECKRLKRKCDRKWPCNCCVARRVAHLCQFGTPQVADAKNQRSGPKPGSPLTPRSTDGFQSNEQEKCDRGTLPDPAVALKALGYFESDVFKSIGPLPSLSRISQSNPDIQAALRALPPRTYADILVNGFFENVNHQYDALHQPTFMTTYVDWWSRQWRSQKNVAVCDVSFAGLLLQICANAVQYLNSPTLTKLESELGEPADSLSLRYHRAAQQLEPFIPPGDGGLIHVQALFLGASWWKTQAQIANSWHGLASAVREAQEIGMHVDSVLQPITDHERELRRKMWYILCIWDKSMCVSFRRPLIIYQMNRVPQPNSGIDQPITRTETSSGTTATILEYEFWSYLHELASPSNDMSISSKIGWVQQWMASLPNGFNFHQAKTGTDTEDPGLEFRRLKLHCMGHLALLTFLRPYLASPVSTPGTIPPSALALQTAMLVGLAIDNAINFMETCWDFFTLCFPDQAKYFLVSFCPFDIALNLCSALLHRPEHVKAPKRLEIARTIGCALYICGKLRRRTKMGEATWCVLISLVTQLNLSHEENEAMDHSRQFGNASIDSSLSSDIIFPIPGDIHDLEERSSAPTPSLVLADGWNPLELDAASWAVSFDTSIIEDLIS
ncbi:N-terminal binuclear Zn cluster-containing/DNA binding domain-containing protein [Thozetella sp. PMI_491]|nr:N-terminal binuclear Zn cluster-containing/DNA binding domain-containing protein [Thozetella sp. PMI_491]